LLVGTIFITYIAIYVTIVLVLFLVKPLYSSSFDYTRKHVVVTGGSSGIGLDVAKEYLHRGSHVTIIARNQQRLDLALEILRPLCQSGQKVTSVSLDCSTSVEAVTAALSPVIESVGDVDVLVNCAGISVAGEFDKTDVEEFDRMLRVNVLGSIYPTRAVVEGMKRNRRGRIVFVSSQVND
jgi:3-dehydrosphinganine reductase